MPRFCVMTFMFKPWWADGRITIEKMLEGFSGLGLEGVEPFHRDFVDDPTLMKRYKKVLDQTGLKVPAVDVIANQVYGDKAQKQAAQDELKRGIDICKDLGADIVHVAGNKLVEGVTPEDGRKMIAEGLAKGADIAESYAMTVAIEDFDPAPTLICSAEDCLQIMQLSGDKVKMVFDTGNFTAVGQRADEVFAQLAERIVHVHIKDGVIDKDRPNGFSLCDIGTGIMPNKEVADLLKQQNYDKWIAIETYGRNDIDPVSATNMEAAAVKKMFE